MGNKKLYKYNDEILFRVCSLGDLGDSNYGDCTNFSCKQVQWKDYYTCNQYGIHYHCAKHPEMELSVVKDRFSDTFYCPKCKNEIDVRDFSQVRSDCLKLLNQEIFKNAELIRLDDYYVHEIKERCKLETDYWLETSVKTDKDGDTIVVLYVGNRSKKSKAQFFIKPEKGQLASDHKDTDPKEVIAKIEVTLRDRNLIQTFDNNEDKV